MNDLDIKLPGWILALYLVYGQGIAALHYDWGVRLGTQDPESAVTAVGVAFWYGFALADLLWYIPLLILGLIFYERHSWGRNALFMALGITVYWPLVCLTAAVSARGAPGWYIDETPFWLILPVIVVWSLYAQSRLCFPDWVSSSYQIVGDVFERSGQ